MLTTSKDLADDLCAKKTFYSQETLGTIYIQGRGFCNKVEAFCGNKLDTL